MSGAAASVAAIVRAAGPHVPPLLARVEERLVDLAAGHGPVLAEHAGATIRAGGKRLRPLLVLLAAGPDARATDDVVAAATAVELVHSATLVHDDVLDAAALRRGVPTVWASAGRDMAIATGDLLFSRAFSELAATGSLEAVRTLSHAGSALAEGELRQRQDAWNVAVGVERYLARCELKTARLFEAPAGWARSRPPPSRSSSTGWARSDGGSAWPFRSSTTSSTSRATPRAPASTVAPICSTGP
jgi:geranylgeranyl pyrophosphate synthase